MLPTVNTSPSAQARMRQEGVDPNREVPGVFHHPQNTASRAQLDDMKRSIESRFASVSTPSNFLQAGLFGAFGNNPITQMATAVGGAAGDVWSSLLSSPEEKENKKIGKAKDPLTALNQHSKLLKEILDACDFTNDLLSEIKSNGGMGGGADGKIGPKSGKFVKKTGDDTKMLTPDEEGEKRNERNKFLRDAYKDRRESLSKELEDEKDPEKKAIKQKQLEGFDKNIERLDGDIKKHEEKHPPKAEDEKDDKKPEEKKEPEQKGDFLDKMILKGVKGVEKFSKALENFPETMKKVNGKLAKNFDDAGKAIKAKSKPLVDAIKGSETAKMLKLGKNALVEKGAKISSVAKSAMAKIAGKSDAEKHAEDAHSKVEPKEEKDPEVRIAKGEYIKDDAAVPDEKEDKPEIEAAKEAPKSSLLSDTVDVAEDAVAAKSGWQIAKGGASKVAGWFGRGAKAVGTAAEGGMDVLRKSGGKALNAAEKAGGFLKSNPELLKTAGKAALIADGAMVSAKGISDEANGKHIESLSDVVPEGWGKIDPLEWANRGGRYAGDKINKGFEATAGGSIGTKLYDWMHADPMETMNKNAAQSLEKSKLAPIAQPSRAEAIDQTKSAIDATKTKAPEKEPQAVIGAVNNVNNSTTVLPSRHDVRNTDVSFNRYMDRLYQ